MSGHYATLLRGTVARMLPKHDVFITDWRDAKLVPVSEGSFDLDDYIDYLIEFSRTIHELTGKRPHMLAVCQPSVPAYAATAIMNADKHPARPKTLTMMGGPVDTRKAPTAVNTLATAAAARLVPAECHRHRADDLPGRRAEGLSGLPAAGRLHDHEPWQRTSSAIGRCSSIWWSATTKARTRRATSTTNICRCAT